VYPSDEPEMCQAICPFCEQKVVICDDPPECPLCSCPIDAQRVVPFEFPPRGIARRD
jgi:hypothetical protein